MSKENQIKFTTEEEKFLEQAVLEVLDRRHKKKYQKDVVEEMTYAEISERVKQLKGNFFISSIKKQIKSIKKELEKRQQNTEPIKQLMVKTGIEDNYEDIIKNNLDDNLEILEFI